jgi:hypothetical protein
MIPKIGEQYWWTVECTTYPRLANTKYCSKVVEVVSMLHEGCITVKVVESNYRGEIGLTFSTVAGCLYDLASKVVEVL